MNNAQTCMFRRVSRLSLHWGVWWWLVCCASVNSIAQGTLPQSRDSDKRHPLSVLIANEQSKSIETIYSEPDKLEIRYGESNSERPLATPQEIDLVQPPLVSNQLNPMVLVDPPCADDFWDQFPTTRESHGHAYFEGNESLQARLRNGHWFTDFQVLFLKPTFQENVAVKWSAGSSSTREAVDFGFDDAYRIDVGFQSFGGTGVSFSYWGLNAFSNLQQYSLGVGETMITSIDLGDSSQQFGLGELANPGSLLSVQQQIQIDSGELTLFQTHHQTVATFQSSLGIRAIRLSQILAAQLDDPLVGIEKAGNKNEFFGVGPQLGVEYFRPLGRTRWELQSGVHGTILVGNRDQWFSVDGVNPQQFQEEGVVETIPIFELYLGLQWTKQMSACRQLFVKTALESQYWANAGSASTVGDDLGFYGFSLGLGLTK